MLTLLIAVAALGTPLVWSYDEKFDKIDVDKIINDDKVFTVYIDCMLDKGPCNVEYSEEFKKLLPEVIETSCANCTPIQKKGVKKTVRALSEKKPSEFAEFKKKYDPKGEYEKDFATFVLSSD